MEYGAHLPLLDFERRWGNPPDLAAYASVASELGYSYLCANDHLVFSRPWLDGLVALASVVRESGSMRLATTVALPTVRGAAALAKSIAAIDLLSGGRMVAGLGPGSSARDYALVGLPFEERWTRFERSVVELRAYLAGNDSMPESLEPRPASPPPIWIGSWGSPAGLRRVARLADGWLASAYNTSPAQFAESLAALRTHLTAAGKDPATFPNALGTMWMYITDDRSRAHHYLEDILCPMLNRSPESVRDLLLIGSPEECAARLRAYRDAGLERVFVWPLTDDVRQIELFATRVMPLVEA